jgi:hypothetical protein
VVLAHLVAQHHVKLSVKFPLLKMRGPLCLLLSVLWRLPRQQPTDSHASVLHLPRSGQASSAPKRHLTAHSSTPLSHRPPRCPPRPPSPVTPVRAGDIQGLEFNCHASEFITCLRVISFPSNFRTTGRRVQPTRSRIKLGEPLFWTLLLPFAAQTFWIELIICRTGPPLYFFFFFFFFLVPSAWYRGLLMVGFTRR